MIAFMKITFKKFKCKILKLSTDSFCKSCGRDIHDFSVSDDVWGKIEPYIKHGNVLCYDCFCDYCGKRGLPTVWELK
jgi:hypothetical protein